MNEKFLPIGTVVLLKEATKKLMITGYCSAVPENPNETFDYVGILFPEGNLIGTEVALFNHDQIGTIVHMGLNDEEFQNLNKEIKELTAAETQKTNNGFANLPKLDKQTLTDILQQIKTQQQNGQMLQEPTAFSEEATKVPNFSLNNSKTSKEEEKEKEEEENKDGKVEVEEKNILNDTSSNGEPVLQLQPIYESGGTTGTETGSAPTSTIPRL